MILSVALCTYNGEKYIAEQLDSILQQSVPADEIVVCDDRSTDGTMQILQKYHSEHPNIFKIYRNEQTLKVIKNFEKAINLCTGDVIFLSDQDDIWFEDKIEKIIHYFEENIHITGVFHNLQLYKNGQPQKVTQWDAIGYDAEYRNPDGILKHICYFENVVTGAAFAMRKHADLSLSPYLLHDYQLALRFAVEKKLGIIADTLGYYRLHDKQLVGSYLQKSTYQQRIDVLQENYYSSGKLEERLKIIARGIEKIRNIELNESIKTKILKELIYDLQQSKRDYLLSLSLIKRISTLVSWAKNRTY